MSKSIADSEVKFLATSSKKLKKHYAPQDAQWTGSPFAWIKTKPSRQRGAIGEKLVSDWLEEHGFSVAPSPDSDADRVVHRKRVEIKFSTRWKSGIYRFQQIRKQKYDVLICLGISPRNASCWVFTKKEIERYWRLKSNTEVKGQHGGKKGDVAWLTIQNPDDPADWLARHGGSLSDALRIFATIIGHTK